MAERSLRLLYDSEAVAAEAATEFSLCAEDAVRRKGSFRVALAGGSTPLALYRLLAGDGDRSLTGRVPWDRTHVFFGDERHVPPDHPDSNYRMARETLLSRVPIPEENVRRILSEEGADEAARIYEETLRESFGLEAGALPRFDLILLGIGADGHTASLFPGSPALRETERLVAAPWVEKIGAFRITLTPRVINNAACVLFMVAGEEKGEALRRVLRGPFEPDRCPAQAIQPGDGRALWLLDRAAGRALVLPD